MPNPQNYRAWLKEIVKRLCKKNTIYEECDDSLLYSRTWRLVDKMMQQHPSSSRSLLSLLVLAQFGGSPERRELMMKGTQDEQLKLFSDSSIALLKGLEIAPWSVPMPKRVSERALLLPTIHPRLYLIVSLKKDTSSRVLSKRFQMAKAIKLISVHQHPSVSPSFNSEAVLQKLYPSPALPGLLSLITRLSNIFFHPYCPHKLPALRPLPPKTELKTLAEMVQNVVNIHILPVETEVKEVWPTHVIDAEHRKIALARVFIDVGHLIFPLSTPRVEQSAAAQRVKEVDFARSCYVVEATASLPGQDISFKSARRCCVVGCKVVPITAIAPGVFEWLAKQRKRLAQLSRKAKASSRRGKGRGRARGMGWSQRPAGLPKRKAQKAPRRATVLVEEASVPQCTEPLKKKRRLATEATEACLAAHRDDDLDVWFDQQVMVAFPEFSPVGQDTTALSMLSTLAVTNE